MYLEPVCLDGQAVERCALALAELSAIKRQKGVRYPDLRRAISRTVERLEQSFTAAEIDAAQNAEGNEIQLFGVVEAKAA